MRIIKFRGFNEIAKKWYYGNLVKHWFLKDSYYIRYQIEIGGRFAEVQVAESSVGQFTGYQDANGVDIYEGDITNLGRVLYENACFKLSEGRTYRYFFDVFSMRQNHLFDILGNEFEHCKYTIFAEFKKNQTPSV